MGYKDLLLVLDESPASRRNTELAAALGARFGAHLAALYPLKSTRFPFFGSYDPAAFDPLFRGLQEKLAKSAQKLREDFERAASQYGISGEWRSPEAPAEADPAIHARYADLVILGQDDPDRGGGELLRLRPESIALASGRPVLVIPYAGNFAAVGVRVLVAWNASREAARAVNDALPFLAAAEKVTVLAIDPRPGEHGEEPGFDISLHLARHGVKAEIERTVAGEVGVGDVLLSRAADLGADLLVMGVYGHTRARELLLGGASKTVLETMTLPVLMSH
jgi:nucleotide-binding universal stress UspA family protein